MTTRRRGRRCVLPSSLRRSALAALRPRPPPSKLPTAVPYTASPRCFATWPPSSKTACSPRTTPPWPSTSSLGSLPTRLSLSSSWACVVPSNKRVTSLVCEENHPLTRAVRRNFGLGVLLRIAALAAAGCAPARSPYALDYPMPKHLPVQTERYRLGNGLEVILSEDHAVPFVAVDLWCHVGSKDDPPHRAGLAHLCEHLMFEGSRHVAPYEHFARLADVGAEDVNAWTKIGRTSFHETVPSTRIETALWLESDRMESGAEMLDQAKLDSERKIVENELR